MAPATACQWEALAADTQSTMTTPNLDAKQQSTGWGSTAPTMPSAGSQQGATTNIGVVINGNVVTKNKVRR